MQTAQPSLIARDDTFFGVCQGLGEDVGFNPLWLRLALTVLLFFNPLAALAAYAAGGAIVLLARTLFPVPRPALVEATAEETLLEPANEPEQLPMAA